jgi:hypothetical protein
LIAAISPPSIYKANHFVIILIAIIFVPWSENFHLLVNWIKFESVSSRYQKMNPNSLFEEKYLLLKIKKTYAKYLPCRPSSHGFYQNCHKIMESSP